MFIFLWSLLTFCQTKTEREHKAGPGMPPRGTVASDGSIHLTPKQVQANGLQTESVMVRNLPPTIAAIGRVVARAGGEAQVFSPFAGRLVADPARLPHVGSALNKGQVLAEVEQLVTASEQVQFAATEAQLQSAFEQAQQEIQLRQTQLDRSRQLYDGGAIPLKQLQTAEFELRQAQARLEGARHATAQYEAILSQQSAGPRRVSIRAPIAGIVVAADLTAGQQIDSTHSLLTIVDLSRLWVEVTIHESDLSLMRRTKSIEFTTPASPGRTYGARLVAVGNVVDPANRTLTVIFEADNPDGSLKIGMTAEARIPTGPSDRVMLIPVSALLSVEGRTAVYVETEPGVYQLRTIIAGQRNGGKVMVTQGLEAGEKVVIVGAGTLRSEALKSQIPTEVEVEKR
jgi:membrane fusion protein, heavy metal efflux system